MSAGLSHHCSVLTIAYDAGLVEDAFVSFSEFVLNEGCEGSDGEGGEGETDEIALLVVEDPSYFGKDVLVLHFLV